jgi:hypothetical protein
MTATIPTTLHHLGVYMDALRRRRRSKGGKDYTAFRDSR